MEPTRRYERFAVTSQAIITLKTKSSEVRSFDGTVLNISFGGMALCAGEGAKIGDRLHALLNFVDAEGRDCEEAVEGEVVWDKEMGSNYIIGVEFMELTPEDHPGLYCSLRDKAQWMIPGNSGSGLD